MATRNYSKQISDTTKVLKEVRKSKEAFKKEKEVLELMQLRQQLIWTQIHEVLEEIKSEESEGEIQELVKNVIINDLPICETKIKSFENAVQVYKKQKNDEQLNLCYTYLQGWLDLYEKDYALASFRSLEHFALYLEWDKTEDGENGKIWKYSIDPFHDGGYSGCTKGFWYYANKMILGKDTNFLMKQMPTAFGKSYSDSVMIAFLYGYKPSLQILKVVGNKSLVSKCTSQIVNIMTYSTTRRRYLSVFPKFLDGLDEDTKYLVMTEVQDMSRLNNKQKEMYTKIQDKLISHIFSICKISEGLFTLNISGRDTNFECITKRLSRDGIACTWLFLDDICQRDEIMNTKEHDKDIQSFNGTWKKRGRDEKELRIVVGGTTYDPYDLLVTLKRRYSKGKVKKSPINKYTTLSLDESAVFVSVPKLDENDQLTFPHKTVLKSVLEDRASDPDLFMAMDMQKPNPPKTSPFYWTSLRTYEAVPQEGRSAFCKSSLDPVRIGCDNVAMGIYVPIGDDFYLIDCIYRNEPMGKVYGLICDKIAQHKITNFFIENNTDTSLKALLDKMLQERGISFCKIEEFYTTEKKEAKITSMENTIKTRIVFPCENLYARNSEMGNFMFDIISYSYIEKNEHDDSIDSVSTFCDRNIVRPTTKTKAKLIYV